MPKEAWQLILETKSDAAEKVTNLCQEVYEQERIPERWQGSHAVQLDKRNGKKGCKAVRLINVMCPMGKVFFSTVWGQNTQSRADCSYAFRKGYRREAAILVQNVTAWKLRKCRAIDKKNAKMYGFTNTLRDVANAFPSPSHDSLGEMIDAGAATAKDARILKHRFTSSRMCVMSKRGRGVVVRPGTGGLQGDVCMPEQFAIFYDKHVEEWIQWRIDNSTGTILAKLGDDWLEVGTTLYADDINEKNLTKDAHEFDTVVRASSDQLDQSLARVGMKQNKGKAEHVCSFGGQGQAGATKQAGAIEHAGGGGEVKHCARYLGNLSMWNGHTSENTKKRIFVAKERYYMWRSFFTELGVRRPLRAKFFKAQVYNTMLTGLECEVMPRGEVRYMDSLLLRWGRSILGQENSTVRDDGSRHQISNNDARRLLRIDTVESTMCCRRLQWLRSILQAPEANKQLIAALVGTLAIEEERGIQVGRSPWVAQWVEDVGRLCEAHGIPCPIHTYLAREGDCALFDPQFSGWIMLYDPRHVLSREDWRREGGEEEEDNPDLLRCDHVDSNGERCYFVGTLQQVHSHKKCHGWKSMERSLTLSNQCPVCRFVGNAKSVKVHVQSLLRNGVCPDASRNQHGAYREERFPLQRLEEEECP